MRKAALLASVFALAAPICAHAQQTSEEGITSLSEIIVTAQKREERLIETPQTVNVVSGEQLEKFAVTRFEDVTKFVPGLDIANAGSRTVGVSLRGVAYDPDAQTSQTVDVYLNEVKFDATQAVQAQFDVGSFQVLRGPQGTLRAGTGPSGAILIGTREPDLNEITGNLSALYTDRESTNVQGGVSVPIIKDKLAVRLAGLYDWNRGLGIHDIVNGGRSSSRSVGARLSVLFKPTDNLSFLLTHQEFRSQIANYRTITSFPGATVGRFGVINPDERIAVTGGRNRQTTKGQATILNGTWEMEGHRLSYIGSYQDNRSNQYIDLNSVGALTPAFLDFVIPGLGNLPYQQLQDLRIGNKRLTSELRFERTGHHFWIYRFGIYGERSKTPFTGLIDYTGGNGACRTTPGPLAVIGLPCLVIGGPPVPKTTERGYFTTQTFNFTDRDTLDVGIRYSDVKTDNPPNDTKFDAWTGTASYKHQFSDDLMVYAFYGRSFRPGGFDSSGSSTGAINPLPSQFYRWRDEKSDSIEFGVKGEALDKRLSYSVAGFYQKFDGFIGRRNNITCTPTPGPGPGPVLVPVGASACRGSGSGNTNITFNGDASVRGIEAEFRGRILPGWTAQLTASYVDAHYDNAAIPCNDYNADGQPDTDGPPAVQPGRYISLCKTSQALSEQPKWSATLSSEYRFDLGNRDAYVRALATYKGKRESLTNEQTFPSSFKVDAFAGVELKKGLEVSVFARNLFNEQNDIVGVTELRDGLFASTTGYTTVDYDPRREFGVQLRYDF